MVKKCQRSWPQVNTPQGIDIVFCFVVSFLNLFSILNLETLLWEPGPAFDDYYGYGTAVQFDDTFVIVGGDADLLIKTDGIWYFDTELYEFLPMGPRLSQAKSKVAAIVAPSRIIERTQC